MNAPRYHHLDALRAVAMLLGILLHAACSFLDMGHAEIDLPWPAADRARSLTLTVFLVGIHAFRMQTFFLMAGFFAHMLLERRGVGGFVAHRTKRVVLPLLLGTVVLLPLTQVLFCIGFGESGRDPYWRLAGTEVDLRAYTLGVSEFFRGGHFVEQFNWMHLWFLLYLLVVYVLFLLAAPVIRRAFQRPRPREMFRYLAGSRLKPLWLALPTCLVMLPMADWGADTPMRAYPEWHIVLYYALFFGFGWVLYAQRDLIPDCGRYWKTYLALAVLLVFPTLLGLVSRGPLAGELHLPALRLPALACYALFTWLMVFGFMGLFIRYFAQASPRMRYISDSSYWLYLAHLPLVIGLQLVIAAWPGPALLKFSLVAAISLVTLMLSYEYCVRYTFIGAVLNGRKYRTASDGHAEVGGEKLPGKLSDKR